MMHSPANIVQQYFVQRGIGVLRSSSPTEDWQIYSSRLPEDRNRAILISNTSGKMDGRYMSGECVNHPGIQVLVRDLADIDCWKRMHQISTLIDQTKRQEVIIESVTYLIENISRMGDPIPLPPSDQDTEIERKRFVYVLNAMTTITVL